MTLTKTNEIAFKFKTSKGLLKISRDEYEALREVMNNHEIELPEWGEIGAWNEARVEFRR